MHFSSAKLEILYWISYLPLKANYDQSPCPFRKKRMYLVQSYFGVNLLTVDVSCWMSLDGSDSRRCEGHMDGRFMNNSSTDKEIIYRGDEDLTSSFLLI